MLTPSRIRGFGSYNAQQLEQMKRDLGFEMPLWRLSFCASYYRTHEKRDPFIEELKMLDLLSEDGAPSPMSAAPTELLTNCDFVAETYADMMKKRHELRPDAKNPCTFAEALGLAGAYLGRAGKEVSLPNALFLLEDAQNTRPALTAQNYIGAPTSRFGLRTVRRQKRLAETGDLLVILKLRGGASPAHYRSALGKLLNTPAATETLKNIRTVGERGLLYEIIHLTDSAYIDLSRLSLTGDDVPLTMLATAYEGDYVVRLSPKAYEGFAKTAYALDIRAMAFATVTHGRHLTFAEGNQQLFSLEVGFLRALFPSRPATVKLNGEENGTPAPILHEPMRSDLCTYLCDGQQTSETVLHNGILYATASCRPENGFFRNALETLLTPVLTLAAAGCDYTTQRAAVGLHLPKETGDAALLGEAMAAILGIYRLQAELGLPLAAGKILTDGQIKHPEITAFCMADGTTATDRFTAAQNHIYCIAPKLQKNGLPDFAALRNLLDYLTKLRRRGALQSARVLCREPITEGIRKMSTDRLTCRYQGHVLVAEGAMELAVLIESSETLSLTEVGTVTERIHPLSAPAEVVLPERASLFPTDEAKIVIYSKQNDLSAELLAERCRERDAQIVPLLVGDDSACFARALLDAQTLIVCTDVPLPHTPQVDFALDTFARAGGRTLLVGEGKKQKKLSGFVLSNGISQKILSQICKNQK